MHKHLLVIFGRTTSHPKAPRSKAFPNWLSRLHINKTSPKPRPLPANDMLKSNCDVWNWLNWLAKSVFRSKCSKKKCILTQHAFACCNSGDGTIKEAVDKTPNRASGESEKLIFHRYRQLPYFRAPPRLTLGGSTRIASFDRRGLVLQRFDLTFVGLEMKQCHWRKTLPGS